MSGGREGNGHARGARYWAGIAATWRAERRQALWRLHSDAVNRRWLERWLPATPVARLLKTDLFDETTSDGLYPALAARARQVVGIDIAPPIGAAALARHPGLAAAAADVRALPFTSGAFDVVVSNSTLDHFPDPADIAASLAELQRVLRPGGLLLLSLDNLANPLVALRNAAPFPLMRRLGLVPYYVGATLDAPRLRGAIAGAGLEALESTAILHCPRAPAVALANLLDRGASPRLRRRFLHLLLGFERLASWPTRYRTGYFVAVAARKPLAARPSAP